MNSKKVKFNSRGQELSTNAIIMIILGVVVLVVLIAGFYLGWGSIKDRIMGSKSNVDKIAEACNLACTTNSAYDYCNMKRELTDEDGNKLQDVTCAKLSLITKYLKYGIQKCSVISSCSTDIECANFVVLNNAGTIELKGRWSTAQCNAQEEDIASIVKPDLVNTDNKYCCISKVY